MASLLLLVSLLLLAFLLLVGFPYYILLSYVLLEVYCCADIPAGSVILLFLVSLQFSASMFPGVLAAVGVFAVADVSAVANIPAVRGVPAVTGHPWLCYGFLDVCTVRHTLNSNRSNIGVASLRNYRTIRYRIKASIYRTVEHRTLFVVEKTRSCQIMLFIYGWYLSLMKIGTSINRQTYLNNPACAYSECLANGAIQLFNRGLVRVFLT